MRSLILIAGTLLLAACGEHPQLGAPPPDKLVCADEPDGPVGLGEVRTDAAGKPLLDEDGNPRRAVTDAEDADYKVALRAAGQDCRDKINWNRDYWAAKQKR